MINMINVKYPDCAGAEGRHLEHILFIFIIMYLPFSFFSLFLQTQKKKSVNTFDIGMERGGAVFFLNFRVRRCFGN